MNDSAELLAPAGDFDTALAAFAAGADAVYCGLGDFSARAYATNLSEDALRDLVRYARASGRKVYVTFNTVIDEDKLEDAIGALSRLEDVGPDGIIVQDLGVARIARKYFPGLELHASTQLVAHNLEGVLALKELGFRRVVLARELSLAEIAQIAKRCGDVELEVFIHGALCYSISGLCLYGAMEKGRSGNRGKCPYCCRGGFGPGGLASGRKPGEDWRQAPGAGQQAPGTFYPFSMKDLRLGEDVRKLVDAGVASLKIEGRMKSPLYVASVTKWYRQILDSSIRRLENSSSRDGKHGGVNVTSADLETVFSRRTTELYLNGRGKSAGESPVDSESLGHRGTPIGTVKKITKDREGRSWLRFHTLRALEKHDGLQFEALTDEGRHFGFGISEMRQAISRAPVFEVVAGADVEVLLPEPKDDRSPYPIRSGDEIYCSMSNAVKRAFPVPSFRRSDYPGPKAIEVEVTIEPERMVARCGGVEAEVPGKFDAAKDPSKTRGAVEKAFSKLGDTEYRLAKLTLVDPDGRFAPASVMNDLRRDLVEALDGARARTRAEKLERALGSADEGDAFAAGADGALSVVKLRAGQKLPAGEWDEVVVAIEADTAEEAIAGYGAAGNVRLATPVWNGELDFNQLRSRVKRLLREGYSKWECADLATLRMLKQVGVEDVTADWSLYAFNGAALKTLAEFGVKRFVASPENNRENLAYLAESGYAVEFLKQQSTPLFISLTEPAETEVPGLAVFRRGVTWVTTKPVPRTFETPDGASTRIDLSWDAE